MVRFLQIICVLFFAQVSISYSNFSDNEMAFLAFEEVKEATKKTEHSNESDDETQRFVEDEFIVSPLNFVLYPYYFTQKYFFKSYNLLENQIGYLKPPPNC